MNPATGERRWHGERYGHGQLLLIENILLLTSEKGELLLFEPNPEAERLLSRLPMLKGKMWNPPALAGGYLLVRNNNEAACYKLPLR
jgi:outer membrane protein assembly factor BamB